MKIIKKVTSTVLTALMAINGMPVTTIGEYVFSNCTGLTSITIPDSVTTIPYIQRATIFSEMVALCSF